MFMFTSAWSSPFRSVGMWEYVCVPYLPKERRVWGPRGKMLHMARNVCVIRFCTQKIPLGGIFLFSAVLLWCPLVYYRLWTLLISVSHNWPITQVVRVCWSLEWIGPYWPLDGNYSGVLAELALFLIHSFASWLTDKATYCLMCCFTSCVHIRVRQHCCCRVTPDQKVKAPSAWALWYSCCLCNAELTGCTTITCSSIESRKGSQWSAVVLGLTDDNSTVLVFLLFYHPSI